MEWEEILSRLEGRILTDEETTLVCKNLRDWKTKTESQIDALTAERDAAIAESREAREVIERIRKALPGTIMSYGWVKEADARPSIHQISDIIKEATHANK